MSERRQRRRKSARKGNESGRRTVTRPADDRRDDTHRLSRALESALGVPPLVEAGRGQVLRAVERELAVSPQVARDSRQRLRLAADRLGQPLPLGEQDVRNVVNTRGLPGYTFERAAGDLWRCRFDAERNIIVVNSGHRDFVFATRNRALQLRYLVRLYVKELVLKNFAGLPADQLLERMIELSLYTEEKLKSG